MSNSAHQVVAAVQAALQQAESAGGTVGACGNAVEQSRAAFGAAGGDDKMAILGEINQKLQAAQGMGVQMETELKAALNLAHALSSGAGGLLNSGGTAAAANSGSSSPLGFEPPRGADGKVDIKALGRELARRGFFGTAVSDPERANPPPFHPMEHNPACFQGLAPRQSGGPARGNLFFPDGRKWNDVPLESTRGETTWDLTIIKPQYRDLKPAQGHLEGNVAAWMLETSNREMVLYINARPCYNKGEGCLPNLEHFLPKGNKLYVWSRRSDGDWKRDIFEGTGQAFQARPGQGHSPGHG